TATTWVAAGRPSSSGPATRPNPAARLSEGGRHVDHQGAAAGARAGSGDDAPRAGTRPRRPLVVEAAREVDVARAARAAHRDGPRRRCAAVNTGAGAAAAVHSPRAGVCGGDHSGATEELAH